MKFFVMNILFHNKFQVIHFILYSIANDANSRKIAQKYNFKI